MFSFFGKSRPAIITDAPYRLEPQSSLPLVCFVQLNECGTITIESISVKITQNGSTILSTTPLQHPVEITTPVWQKVFIIQLPDSLQGMFNLDSYIHTVINGKTRTIRNSSCRGVKNQALEIFRSAEPVPRIKGLHYGDLHFHNYYTGGLSEFAVPTPASAEVARSIGLDFYTSVLHSNNAGLGEGYQEYWRQYVHEIDSRNSSDGIFILPAEEITCRNGKGRSINLLTINNSEYVIGTGRSSKRITGGSGDFSLQNVVKTAGPGAAHFALFSEQNTAGIRRIFARSRNWKASELETPDISGLKLGHMPSSEPDKVAIDNWLGMLLKGKKKYVVAGSNAAGSLNKRSLRIFPFFKSKTDFNHVFGLVRTGILCRSELDRDTIVTCLKEGRNVVTSGPLLNFRLRNQDGKHAHIGGELGGTEFLLKTRAISTSEFGPIKKVLFYFGDIKSKAEELIFTFNFSRELFNKYMEIVIEPRSAFGYIRGEVWTENDSKKNYCITNPIWIREEKA